MNEIRSQDKRMRQGEGRGRDHGQDWQVKRGAPGGLWGTEMGGAARLVQLRNVSMQGPATDRRRCCPRRRVHLASCISLHRLQSAVCSLVCAWPSGGRQVVLRPTRYITPERCCRFFSFSVLLVWFEKYDYSLQGNVYFNCLRECVHVSWYSVAY